MLADRTRDLTRDTCHLLIACARARAPFFTTCNYFTVTLNPTMSPPLPTLPYITTHRKLSNIGLPQRTETVFCLRLFADDELLLLTPEKLGDILLP